MSWRRGEATSSHDVFFVDRNGIPHWDGSDPPKYLKKYKARVDVGYESDVRDSDIAKERKANVPLRLMRGLTGKVWDIVEPLFSDRAKLRIDGAHHSVLASLDTLDKAAVLKKQDKFDFSSSAVGEELGLSYDDGEHHEDDDGQRGAGRRGRRGL
jgi:hypothetical protein